MANCSLARRPGRFWPTCSLMAIAGFVLLSLCARWSPLEAQQAQQKKKKSEPIAPAKETAGAKAKPNASSVQSLTLGKKIDAAALAKLIDQQVQQRLKEEKAKPSPLADDAEFL